MTSIKKKFEVEEGEELRIYLSEGETMIVTVIKKHINNFFIQIYS